MTSATIHRQNGNQATDKPKPEQKQPPPRFQLVTCRALDAADYTPRPIIEDCLYAGHPAIDGGMFKTGKTLLAIDGAIAIGTGRPFLNTFTVPEPMGVVYFSGEGGPSMVQEYARRIADSKGLALSDVFNVHWCFSIPRLEDRRDLDAVQKIHDQTAAEVMVFDNLMLAMGADEPGNVFRMGQALGNVIRICNERGITPLFVHHFKRTRATEDRFAPGELLDLTQAGAAEIAGQWWLLTRREPYNPEQPGEHRLWLNIGGRLGHGCLHGLDLHEGRSSDPDGRRWEVEVHPATETRETTHEAQQQARQAAQRQKQEARLEADRAEIVGAAVKASVPDTKAGWRDRVAIPHKRFPAAFASLITDGTLQRASVTKSNGQTYDGWELRKNEEA
jgi:hypothetical protein